ncbi:MAG TPA: AMIN domain-containing protein [Myxococcales bacterium]|nr:AMIN domain-containing protein [Myxococcales bacterium]
MLPSSRSLTWCALPALLLGSLPALSQAQNAVTSVTFKDGHIEIAAQAPPNFTTFTMSDPTRLVVDISNCVFKGVPQDMAVNQDPVTSIKAVGYGAGASAVARVLIGFSKDVDTDIATAGNTLIVKIGGGQGVASAAPAAAPAQAAPAQAAPAPAAQPAPTAQPAPQPTEAVAANDQPPPSDQPPPAEAAPPAAPPPAAPAAQPQAAAAPPPAEQPQEAAPAEPPPTQAAPAAQPAPSPAEAPAAQPAAAPAPTAVAQNDQPPPSDQPPPTDDSQVQPAPAPAAPPPAAPPQAAAPAQPPPTDQGPPPTGETPPAAETPPPTSETPPPTGETPPPTNEAPAAAPTTAPIPAPTPASIAYGPAYPAPPPEGAPTEVSRRTKRLALVGFRASDSQVFIRTNEPVAYNVSDGPDGSVLVTIENTRIVRSNDRRPIDAHFFPTPVSTIRARQVRRNVVVEIRLKNHAPYRATQRGQEVELSFSNGSIGSVEFHLPGQG